MKKKLWARFITLIETCNPLPNIFKTKVTSGNGRCVEQTVLQGKSTGRFVTKAWKGKTIQGKKTEEPKDQRKKHVKAEMRKRKPRGRLLIFLLPIPTTVWLELPKLTLLLYIVTSIYVLCTLISILLFTLEFHYNHWPSST